MLEDITSLNKEQIHFLGSIVVVPEGQHKLGVNYFQLVDGQQRLATVLIWLSAIRDIAKENGNHELARYLTETFLFAKEWEGGKQKSVPKLQLGSLDDEAFRRILEGKGPSGKHLIFECYRYFRQGTKDINVWQTLLDNTSVVHINAFNHLNAFRLFETLNDRGLELSAADLIKNFVLMRVSSDPYIFDTTVSEWTEMYEKLRDKEPVKFIRRYMLSRYKGKVSETRLYEAVVEKLKNKSPEEICNFVKDLNLASTVYRNILESNFHFEKVNNKLKELHLVEVAPSYTLLLRIMPSLESGQIHEDDVIEILEMIEVFHIRWGICGQTTSRLDQIYNDICMNLSDVDPSEFKVTVGKELSQQVKNNLDDEIFRRNFISRTFKPTETRTKYILWKLSEPTGETSINIRNIQTEHIMPKRLSNEWISYLKEKTSKDEREIKAMHAEHLNRIGNLTIIKGEWNTSMSNRLFNVKKEDYRKSEFQITKEISDYAEWTFSEIEKRTERLAEKALEIWKWRW